MFFQKIKNLLKFYFPNFSRKLIEYRDSNLFNRITKSFFYINLKKNIHGKKIVNKERGFILDFSIDNFVSYVIRPKKTNNIIIDSQKYSNSDTAIIIQGGLNGVLDFVSESIDLYLNLFSDSKIILSTWKDDLNNNFLSKYQNKIHIIANHKPAKIFHNTDLQIISTYSAIEYAKNNNFKYCLKTRTDCRLYNNNSIKYLKNLLKIFPIDEKYKNLNSRIISCSNDTRKFRVYGLSDILLFGEIENMLTYFYNEQFELSLNKYFGNYPCIIKDTAVINEIFLCARYLKNSGINLEWTLGDWWKICGEIFCIVDPYSIDFFWYKYHWKYEQRFIQNYTSDNKQALTFSDWLNLYIDKDFIFDESNKEVWKIKDGIIAK